LAFLGAALVDVATLASGSAAPKADSMLLGDALLLFAAVSWSFFVILSQPLVQELGAVVTLCVVFLMGTLWHLPVAAVEWLILGHGVSPMGVTWRGWAGLAYLTLITAYLNYLLWYVVTARYDITRSAVVTNAHFLVTVGLEAILFCQPIGPAAWVGSALLLSGIVLATRTPPRASLRAANEGGDRS
jgi:drug/metabolite transporter (DMT)-like permease